MKSNEGLARAAAPLALTAALALVAGGAVWAQADTDALDPPKEYFESKATIEAEEDEEAEEEPTLASRCYTHALTVPEEFAELERLVEKWIATCVASRTLVDGKPIRRERALVRGNASLAELWVALEPGEETEIEADYSFEGRRVVAIDFY